MSDHSTHKHTDHAHGDDCGHTAIKHGDHYDYLHDGHMHHPHGDHSDEHSVDVSDANPDDCTSGHDCSGHDSGHVHGDDCGHVAVPHGTHTDYLVDGHLHHQHGGHCDDHGAVETA